MSVPRRFRQIGLLALACALPGLAHADAPVPFAELERRVGGRLGVVAVDTATGQRIAHRGDERFLLCSTFKLLLVAQVLHRVDVGEERLERRIAYDAADLQAWSPETAQHVATGMTVEALSVAALQQSDNTAANLLLRTQGGPEGLTRYVRALGDAVTRLDRIEPALNVPAPGDLDTTTPAAMAKTVRALLLGDALTPASRQRLAGWLEGNTTGGRRLRAGLPRDWRVGDKTGTSDDGSVSDVALATPPGRPPWIIVAYLMGCHAPREACEDVLAEAARRLASPLGAPYKTGP
jgi:beta-lactamase class A